MILSKWKYYPISHVTPGNHQGVGKFRPKHIITYIFHSSSQYCISLSVEIAKVSRAASFFQPWDKKRPFPIRNIFSATFEILERTPKVCLLIKMICNVSDGSHRMLPMILWHKAQGRRNEIFLGKPMSSYHLF